MRRILTATLILLISASLHAQQQPTTGATITGIIFCADTGRPARFAHVSLVPAMLDEAAADQYVKSSLSKQQVNSAPSQPSAQQLASMRSSYTRQVQLTTEQSTFVAADLTGRYTIAGVAPGVYYLHVRLDGYADALDQFTLDQVTSSDPATARGIAALVQRIIVTGSEEQRLDVRLERGASLTGRIFYDDGAPAVGWGVTAMPEAMLHRKPTSTTPMSVTGIAGMSNRTTTDDLGNFRIRGLAAGTYGLAVSIVETPSTAAAARYPNVLHIGLYSGDTFHAGEAKTYTLTAGANRDVVITVPLNKVHNIRGLVVAQSDGHSPNKGSINLTSKDDPGFLSFTSLAPDGSFQFDEVPAGSYTLIATGVSDAQTTPTATSGSSTPTASKPAHRYGQASLPIMLNDVDLTSIALTVPDIQPSSSPSPDNPATPAP